VHVYTDQDLLNRNSGVDICRIVAGSLDGNKSLAVDNV